MASDSSPQPRWRIVVAGICLFLAGAAVSALLFGTGSSDPTANQPAERDESAEPVREAFAKLAETSAAVSSSMVFSPNSVPEGGDVPTTTTEPLPEGSDVNTGTPDADPDPDMALDSGVVDFKNSNASMSSPEDSVMLPPTVVVDGTAYLDWGSAAASSLTPDLDGWAKFPVNLRVGVDSNASPVLLLMDLVSNYDTWLADTGVKEGPATYRVALDDAAVTETIDARLAELDPERADAIRAEIESGTRPVPSGDVVVTIGKSGMPTDITMAVNVAGSGVELTWKLSDFGVAVDVEAPDDVQIDYTEILDRMNDLRSGAVEAPAPPTTATSVPPSDGPIPQGPGPIPGVTSPPLSPVD